MPTEPASSTPMMRTLSPHVLVRDPTKFGRPLMGPPWNVRCADIM